MDLFIEKGILANMASGRFFSLTLMMRLSFPDLQNNGIRLMNNNIT